MQVPIQWPLEHAWPTLFTGLWRTTPAVKTT